MAPDPRDRTPVRCRCCSLVAIAALALVLTACASSDRPTFGTETLPPADDVAVDAEEVAAADAVDDDVAPPGNERVRALITPTGVVVPVLSTRDDRYLVLTPCGNQAEIVWGTPFTRADIDVVLDPGHGGNVETGAVGPNGLAEKDLNLDLARLTARVLDQRGISSILTRTADYRVPIFVRAELGNRLDAEAIVSIHHNAPTANISSTPGTEVFVQKEDPESARLGGLLQEEIVDALSGFDGVTWSTAPDAGVLEVLKDDGEESYGMIRRPRIPAVLAELAYLSNPPEAELLATDEYLSVAAEALANGIERFLDTDDEGVPLRPDPRLFTPSGATGGADGCEDPPLE